MPGTHDTTEAAIWTDAKRSALCRRVAEALPAVRVLAVGSGRRSDAAELAEPLDAEPFDDLRQMLVERPPSHLLLATTVGVKRDDLRAALADGVNVLTFDPFAGNVDQVLSDDRNRDTVGRLVQAPLLRLTPGWRAAADPQQVTGPVRSLNITAVSPPEGGSLFARLADAFDTAIHLIGIPERIDAMLATTLPEPPQELRGLTGSMSVQLRYGDDAGATFQVSDDAAVWRRALVAVGAQATFRLHDAGYELFGPEAELIDSATDLAEPDPAALIAEQWRWMITHRSGPAPVDRRAVIACCETALLSCRTGESESPDTLLRLQG